MMGKKTTVLCILDGWGECADQAFNAIRQAKAPTWAFLNQTYPHAYLQASGMEVGLPEGQMGNSEVGHMTIGAGRVIYQDLPRISKAVQENTIPENPTFQTFIDKALQGPGKACHLVGLLSPGGVHSHQDHLAYMARCLAEAGLDVWIHAFLDGRDTPPQSAERFLKTFLDQIASQPRVQIATLAGRFYGMDRDNRWERVQQAYATLVQAEGAVFEDPIAYVQQQYAAGITDEFIVPAHAASYAGMQDGDALLMGNFRADRVRQLLHALIDKDFADFARPKYTQFSSVMGMAHYSDQFQGRVETLFPPIEIHQCLGEVVSSAGLRQLRVAETEKYAHVTFFLNGGHEAPFAQEDRTLVPSPKVTTYDLQPQMSAPEVARKVTEAIQGGTYDLIVVNFANTDMVGHTGDLAAATQSVESVDACLAQIHEAILTCEGALVITADHGNAEVMYDPETQGPHTAHTTSPVPLLVCGIKWRGQGQDVLSDGGLADVAPTVLKIMGLPVPKEMSGRCLLKISQAACVG